MTDAEPLTEADLARAEAMNDTFVHNLRTNPS